MTAQETIEEAGRELQRLIRIFGNAKSGDRVIHHRPFSGSGTMQIVKTNTYITAISGALFKVAGTPHEKLFRIEDGQADDQSREWCAWPETTLPPEAIALARTLREIIESHYNQGDLCWSRWEMTLNRFEERFHHIFFPARDRNEPADAQDAEIAAAGPGTPPPPTA